VVVVLSSTGYVLERYYYARLTKIGIALPHSFKQPRSSLDIGSMNVLLVGSDTRQGKGNSAYQAGAGQVRVSGQRSDTMMLVHIPSGGSPITVVSLPRDSWVYIPAWHGHPGFYQKLNVAIEVGGPQLLIATIEHLAGVQVNHFVQIDFAGFERMVNAIGGITVCTRTARHDPNSGDFLTAGVHHLNGRQALAFVRDRESFALQDITRMQDQQYFLSVMLKKVMSTGVLANPIKLNSFLSALAASVTVDKNFSFDDLRNFALAMRHIGTKNVRFLTLPYTNPGFVEPDGEDAVELDPAKDHAIFVNWNRAPGTAPHAKQGPATYTVTVAPSGVSLDVLNGSTVTGLAHRAAAALTGAGFHVAAVGNAPSVGNVTGSVVRYAPPQLAEARTVAAAVPGASLQQDPSLGSGTVQLILGSGFATLKPVHVGEVVVVHRVHHRAVGKSAAAMSCAP
jgi:LCP family protein required for cell wall assembly